MEVDFLKESYKKAVLLLLIVGVAVGRFGEASCRIIRDGVRKFQYVQYSLGLVCPLLWHFCSRKKCWGAHFDGVQLTCFVKQDEVGQMWWICGKCYGMSCWRCGGEMNVE